MFLINFNVSIYNVTIEKFTDDNTSPELHLDTSNLNMVETL